MRLLKAIAISIITAALPLFSAEEAKVINIDLFVMSMCPYGIQAQNTILPILKDMHGKVNLNIFFIATENAKQNSEAKVKEAAEPQDSAKNQNACYDTGEQTNGKFSSLHGDPEITEDIRQLVILKYYKDKYIDYLLLRNKDVRGSDAVQIMKSIGIDADYVENLVKTEDGEKLLSENIKEAEKRKINASPTMFVNNVLIDDAITANRLIRNLCKYTDMVACADLPICGSDNDCAQRPNMITACINPEAKDAQCVYGDDIPVKITVVNDSLIPALHPEAIVAMMKNYFPSAAIMDIDYKSEDGKKLIERYSVDFLPAIIVEEKVEDSVRFPKIAQFMRKAEDSYIFKNEYFANRYYFKRPLKNSALELFVNSMSQNAVRLENFLLADNRYSFTINYNVSVTKKRNDENQLLMSKDENGDYKLAKVDYRYDLKSELGKEDIYEDISQLCISKYNPELVRAYLRCFTNNFSSDVSRNNCKEFILPDSQKISNCAKDADGIEMLAKNAAYGKNIGIGSDTAVLIHNQVLLQEFDFNIIYEILEKSDL